MMAKKKTDPRYLAIVTVCADSIEQLRTCDLHRALDQAKDMGICRVFAAWLMSVRPDIHRQINSAALDVLNG